MWAYVIFVLMAVIGFGVPLGLSALLLYTVWAGRNSPKPSDTGKLLVGALCIALVIPSLAAQTPSVEVEPIVVLGGIPLCGELETALDFLRPESEYPRMVFDRDRESPTLDRGSKEYTFSKFRDPKLLGFNSDFISVSANEDSKVMFVYIALQTRTRKTHDALLGMLDIVLDENLLERDTESGTAVYLGEHKMTRVAFLEDGDFESVSVVSLICVPLASVWVESITSKAAKELNGG